jgi:flavorubredoxin
MISESIKYVGVNDHKLDLFEGKYIIPNGIAYN